MASHQYIRIEGEGFEQPIRLESFAWGMGLPPRDGGGSVQTPTVGDLTFSHRIDAATPRLMDACCAGRLLERAVLTCSVGGAEATPYLTVAMRHVFVTTVMASSLGSDVEPTETVTLAFGEHAVSYQALDESGAAKGQPVQARWTLEQRMATS